MNGGEDHPVGASKASPQHGHHYSSEGKHCFQLSGHLRLTLPRRKWQTSLKSALAQRLSSEPKDKAIKTRLASSSGLSLTLRGKLREHLQQSDGKRDWIFPEAWGFSGHGLTLSWKASSLYLGVTLVVLWATLGYSSLLFWATWRSRIWFHCSER